jgi:predicted O-methyltransferase YrrM
MSQERWTAIDRYFADRILPGDDVLERTLAANDAASLPAFDVAPNQGKLLQILARLCGARRVLEIGTLGGYSTIWLARALPHNGRLVTLEADPHHASVARDHVARAGLAGVVDVRLGKALDTLPELAAENGPPFDLIFIDADKQHNPEYFAWALKLARRGSLIVVDNVVRGGAVLDAASDDPIVKGVRRLVEMVGGERRVSATALQTVGSKGHDGFLIALVTEDDPRSASSAGCLP